MSNPISHLERARLGLRACCRTRYLLPALLLLGAAARVRQYLAVTSYWHDEAYLLLNVFPKSFIALVGPLSHEQAAPPLFLWFLRICYLVAGPTELAMRFPALLASLAALVLLVPLARVVVGRGWLWAVACAAVSSSLLYLTYQVKPYTTDVLVAEIVVLATVCCLDSRVPRKTRRAGRLGLLLAALIGPWLSFPSVFVLGGACLALAGAAVSRRIGPSSAGWKYPCGVATLLVSSCLLVWWVAARHHNTPYQQTFWQAEFVDLSSVGAALGWLAGKCIEAGNYGVQGTGIPMALLAAAGLARCTRQRPWLAIALAAPAMLACCAAALRHYPLGNRLLAFLLPCLWLLAAQGMALVTSYLRPRAGWLAAALPVVVLLPAGIYTARYAVVAKPSVEFRQAFAYLNGRMREGDTLWLTQPEVYQVYFGRRPNVLDAKSSRDNLVEAARRGRVWMVCHPPASQNAQSATARRHIESCGARESDRLEFVHLDVSIFTPPASMLAAD
ncbi:MAG TPA: glycosyltransferase family 39 protein [Pirellulales bacterium]|nr:glycosyltransferase family 39 protein [Pirellulales bacterium]